VALRFDDANRTLELSVRDLVEAGAPTGDLVLQTVLSAQARMAAGREVHVDWQADRGQQDGTFAAEVRLRRQIAVGDWTVVLHGRVDGLSEDGGVPVVEEVKSTALDAHRLFATTAKDWPAYVAQLEAYLWMIAEERRTTPHGRLVLVSLLDGSRHALGVSHDHAAVGGAIRRKLDDLVFARERRLAWLGGRRRRPVPVPHSAWRTGQEDIAEATFQALERGSPLLVEAPTGLGKTAAVLHGVLRHALARDKQVFWATARTTQQRVALATLMKFREAGLPLRIVTVSARERACLNDVVACRPDKCRFAAGYFDKVREHDLVTAAHESADSSPEAFLDLGRKGQCCPWQLAVDAAAEADVIVGDYNYVFDPGATLRTLFAEEPERFVVVVDEAHQLPDRARGYASPRVEFAKARTAEDALRNRALFAGHEPDDSPFTPFVQLARDVADAVLDAGNLATARSRDGVAVAELSATPWRALADRIDEVAIDYARLQSTLPPLGAVDPWIDCARQVQRIASALESSGDEVVHIVGDEGSGPFAGLLCLDPSKLVGQRVASLGGFVAASATLAPSAFYRDLLGLDERFQVVRAGSPFPPENRKVVLAPKVSTAWKDRPAHAPRTAALIQECILATPGNVAVYFPSFDMLRDLVGRLVVPDRELLVQERSMPEPRRLAWLERLGQPGPPLVLCAVLGGIFAEGIDLPPGALHAVVVVGPALPPVGLERDLLSDWYERRYGEGFRYASLVPGMTRVVQAAGRLVRRPEDRGVVVLIGRRFRQEDARALLPDEWDVEVADDPAPHVAAFWEGR